MQALQLYNETNELCKFLLLFN